MKFLRAFTLQVFFVLYVVELISAKPPKTLWQTGQLALWSDSLLTGALAYNWSAEMVMLRLPDGHIRTFSAAQVRRFDWFDQRQNKLRTFVSLESPLPINRTRQAFYEVWLNGPLTVVRRLKRAHGPFKRLFVNPTQCADTPMLSESLDQFDYFVHDEGRFLSLDWFYRDIYEPLLAAYDRELHQFIQDHNLNERTVLGRLILIDRFNYLSRHNPKTASVRSVSNALE